MRERAELIEQSMFGVASRACKAVWPAAECEKSKAQAAFTALNQDLN